MTDDDSQAIIPLVSVIIPTFNSSGTISRCLQAIKDQTYSNIEVLVVDRYSRDDTVNLARTFNTRIILKEAERSSARNLGALEANGSFIFFVDSDMELTPRVTQKCVAACLSKGTDAVIAPEVPITDGFLSECRSLEKKLHSEDRLFEAPRFFRKDTFQKLGGYDEDLAFGEDSDLYERMRKAGVKTTRIHAEIKHNEGKQTMRKLVLKAHYYGTSLPALLEKNPYLVMKKHFTIKAPDILGTEALFKDPLHFAGLAFMKVVEYEAYAAGILLHILTRKQ